MKIQMTIGDTHIQGTLNETPASRDLLAQLPLTLELEDFSSLEKVGPLPAPLSTAGQTAGADPNVGDIGYYAPWKNFVLYYGEQTYHDGIVILGKLDNGVDHIANLKEPVTVSLERTIN
jgi:hypothetical protein